MPFEEAWALGKVGVIGVVRVVVRPVPRVSVLDTARASVQSGVSREVAKLFRT